MRVLVFGDSIVQGGWDVEVGGWAARLRRFYDTRMVESGFTARDVTIFNLGISGETSSGLVKRLENEIAARNKHGDQQIIVIAIGLNNAMLAPKRPPSTPEAYLQDLSFIHDTLKRLGHKQLFVGLTAVDDNRTHPVNYDPDISYDNQRSLEFEAALEGFCRDNQVPFVKLFDEFKSANEKSNLLEDGVHPNAAGHEFIYSKVKPELEKLLQ